MLHSFVFSFQKLIKKSLKLYSICLLHVLIELFGLNAINIKENSN